MISEKDIKCAYIGICIIISSAFISLTIIMYSVLLCVKSDNQRKIEYYKAVAPIAQEWAKQGVKNIKID